MLISHLIRELKKAKELWGDAEVITEGCDCSGDTFCIEHNDWDKDANSITICRSPHSWDVEEEFGREYENTQDTFKPLSVGAN